MFAAVCVFNLSTCMCTIKNQMAEGQGFYEKNQKIVIQMPK